MPTRSGWQPAPQAGNNCRNGNGYGPDSVRSAWSGVHVRRLEDEESDPAGAYPDFIRLRHAVAERGDAREQDARGRSQSPGGVAPKLQLDHEGDVGPDAHVDQRPVWPQLLRGRRRGPRREQLLLLHRQRLPVVSATRIAVRVPADG